MSVNVVLVAVVGTLFAVGVYLLLERSLTRVVLGLLLISNGVNVLFLIASGGAGQPPIVGSSAPERMSDPLPQALVLTAIVITLGVTAFLLAMAYRSWQLHEHDEVQDDVEDALIRRRAERDEASSSYDDSAGGTLDERGADPAGESTQDSRDGDGAPIGPEGETP
ncbi:multisubunit sodium/proton antiporter MrpC subunit [Haloactinopolyspora alba]|uniref:Multisubunit sodium/proton antiporter MrpC subunit n=1 Tax=Haloactinopolyspora alba TaxID=648780 RepID=A0A2P8E2I3_9ACTN|nr:Na(+)/H(+) antiporter subunit C [Haloactinopolyspora alba]PSL03678.1 multisubunit sodium/proton antiporter MrpC subunit [Haloactinopolyspora alba]